MKEDIELTDRELAIAERAADIAVKRMMDEFYKGVGKSVVQRFLVILGAVVIAFAAGKGWISLK
ncbi:MAG: hypothetical protein RJA99_3154 [Pseudomonadota bacterium]|jgi:hypothetical protein